MEFGVLMIILWLLMGLWASSIMKGKGRAPALGWALGLIFGIFGVIGCALFPTNNEELWRRQAEAQLARDQYLEAMRNNKS